MQNKLCGLFFLAGRSKWWALCLRISCKFKLLSNIIHGNLSSGRQNLQYFCLSVFCFFYPGFTSLCLLSLTSAYNTSVGGGRWGNFNSMHVASVKKNTKQNSRWWPPWQQLHREETAALCFPLLVISATTLCTTEPLDICTSVLCLCTCGQTQEVFVCIFCLFVCSLLFMPVQNGEQCYGRQGWDWQRGRNGKAMGGRNKTAQRGQKSMLCKCCTHLQFFSSCDGCVAIALSKVVAGKRA